MSLRAVVKLVVFSVGCTQANPAATCSTGTCIDPAFPYCDSDGVIGGVPGACIAVSCNTGEIRSCAAGNAMTCNGKGNGYDRVACALDCLTTPAPHCATIEPRYLPTICDSAATAELALTGSGIFDPNLDTNCSGGIVAQTGGPDLCVAHARNIALPAGVTITVQGLAPGVGRALALVADIDVTVDGEIDASAHGHLNGPGGGVPSSSTGGAPSGMRGGGGGGGRTAGAAGGNGSTDGGGANAGAMSADPALLSAFIGGASAYKMAPVDDPDDVFGGGGGGGAVTLIACRGRVSITGVVNVGGGGGKGGVPFGSTGSFHGFGGGAGGQVVIQAASVSITGGVFANGGAGGNGMRADRQRGFDGPDGTKSASIPARTGNVQNGEGKGGDGGVGIDIPTAGLHPSSASASCGGGGGSVGFLQVYTPRGVTPTLTPTAVSPPFQPNGTIPIR